ncbi:adenylate/guanylate cyclase domain-containing protein [Rhizobium sp. ZPR3]|uniref:Adenylate/guanylate cyclase domain-containing protein n=2 Tax=unclassified Rhizobium TaxID=2613769 RepID=A0AAU7SQV0_9HYPH
MNAHQAISQFLAEFCPSPTSLEAFFLNAARRVLNLRDGQLLCRKGDEADEMWLILKGQVRVEDRGLIAVRSVGEIVGEVAFVRVAPKLRLRGADMVALGELTALRIDASLLEEMDQAQRLVWKDTLLAVLAGKLDQAQGQRADLNSSSSVMRDVMQHFVCAEAFSAAWAAITDQGFSRIDPEVCQAIVWFSDIAGFSSYAADLGPAEVGGIVREIMDVQTAIVASAGGQVDKYMGDGLMCFWRVPDDVRLKRFVPRAVTAALEAGSTLGGLIKERGLPLDVRIGMHIGKVTVGDFGGANRVAFTLIGETVNTASRYEQARTATDGLPLGRVRISDALFEALPDDLRSNFDNSARQIADKHSFTYGVRSSLDRAAVAT